MCCEHAADLQFAWPDLAPCLPLEIPTQSRHEPLSPRALASKGRLAFAEFGGRHLFLDRCLSLSILKLPTGCTPESSSNSRAISGTSRSKRAARADRPPSARAGGLARGPSPSRTRPWPACPPPRGRPRACTASRHPPDNGRRTSTGRPPPGTRCRRRSATAPADGHVCICRAASPPRRAWRRSG